MIAQTYPGRKKRKATGLERAVAESLEISGNLPRALDWRAGAFKLGILNNNRLLG